MSSGSDTDSDGERLRLQEAVQGAVGLVGEDTSGKKKWVAAYNCSCRSTCCSIQLAVMTSLF